MDFQLDGRFVEHISYRSVLLLSYPSLEIIQETIPFDAGLFIGVVFGRGSFIVGVVFGVGIFRFRYLYFDLRLVG